MSIASADMMNGIASPQEYTTNSNIPSYNDVVTAATVKILANMGPIHGVQPAPNPIPISNEPTCPAGLLRIYIHDLFEFPVSLRFQED